METVAGQGWMAYQRKVAFTCFGFSHDVAPSEQHGGEQSDPYQPIFAALDQRGHVYAFDLKKNRYASWMGGIFKDSV